MPFFDVSSNLRWSVTGMVDNAMAKKRSEQVESFNPWTDGKFSGNSKKTIFDVPIKWKRSLPGCFRILQWIYPRDGGRRIGLYEYLCDPYKLRCERVFAWKDGSGQIRAITRPRHLLPPAGLRLSTDKNNRGGSVGRPNEDRGDSVSRSNEDRANSASRSKEDHGDSANRPTEDREDWARRANKDRGDSVSRPNKDRGDSASRPNEDREDSTSRPKEHRADSASRPTEDRGDVASRPIDGGNNPPFMRKQDRNMFATISCRKTSQCGSQVYHYQNNSNVQPSTSQPLESRKQSNRNSYDRDQVVTALPETVCNRPELIQLSIIDAGVNNLDRTEVQQNEPKWIQTTIDKLQCVCVPNISPKCLTEDNRGPVIVGEGAFGRVHLKTLNTNPVCQVVVKTFFNEKVTRADVLREAGLLSYLNKTGVIPKFYGVTTTKEHTGLAIVQEYFGQGRTLLDLINASPALSKDTWVGLALQLARALLAIHGLGVLINDLKEDNILVDNRSGSCIAKYIDFGSATYREGCVHQIKEEDTEKYPHLAPEVKQGHLTSTCADVFSLGVAVESIMAEGYVDGLWDIVTLCMDDHADRRPDISTIITLLAEVKDSLVDEENLELDIYSP